jgi:Tfp pilus assembly ATPase PilU
VLAQRLIPTANKKSRVLATELLVVEAPAQRHIREKEFHQLVSVIQTGRKKGMHSMDDSLYDLYQSGEITYEAAINHSVHPTHMRQRIFNESNDMQ